jgi:hypothetical protein
MIDEQVGWGLSDDRRVLRTEDGAQHFRAVTEAGPACVLHAADGEHAVVACVEGSDEARFVGTRRTADGGRSFAESRIVPEKDDSPFETVTSLTASSPSDVALVVAQVHGMNSSLGLFYRSSDGAASWTRVGPVGDSVLSLEDKTHAWTIRYDCTTCPRHLEHSMDGGKNFMRLELRAPRGLGCKTTEPGPALAVEPPVFAAQGGLLRARCDDPSERNVLFFSAGSARAERSWTSTRPFDAELVALRPPRSGWALARRANSFALSRTLDAGATWLLVATKLDALSGTTPVELRFVSDQAGFLLANRDGGPSLVLRTTDGGKSWL